MRCGAPAATRRRRWVTGCIAALLPTVVPARADVRDFLGRPVASVRVEVGGQPLADPALLPLIETRVGEALSMRRVRETIDHLVGLGRFLDIRVRAEAATAVPEGVALVWTLVPVQRVGHVEFAGQPALSQSALRAEINERVGLLPATTRVGEIVQALTAFYRERGYQQPQIRQRLAPGRQPEEVTLILAIEAGARTTIGNVAVKGEAGEAPAALIAELRLAAGRPVRSAGDRHAARRACHQAARSGLLRSPRHARTDLVRGFHDGQPGRRRRTRPSCARRVCGRSAAREPARNPRADSSGAQRRPRSAGRCEPQYRDLPSATGISLGRRVATSAKNAAARWC